MRLREDKQRVQRRVVVVEDLRLTWLNARALSCAVSRWLPAGANKLAAPEKSHRAATVAVAPMSPAHPTPVRDRPETAATGSPPRSSCRHRSLPLTLVFRSQLLPLSEKVLMGSALTWTSSGAGPCLFPASVPAAQSAWQQAITTRTPTDLPGFSASTITRPHLQRFNACSIGTRGCGHGAQAGRTPCRLRRLRKW
jgi:hypothetical protein